MKKKLLTRFAIVRDHIPERKHSKKIETEKENIIKGRMQILIERLEDITISGKNKRLRFGNSSEALGNHLPDGIEPGQQFFVISSLATRKTYTYPCHLYELDDDLSKFCAVTVVDSDYTKPVLNLQDNGLLDAKRLEKDIKQKEGFIAQNIPYYGETSPTAKVISEEFLTQHYLLKTVFSGSMLIAILCFPCKNYILDTRTRNILTSGSKKNV